MREPRDYQREAADVAARKHHYVAFQCGLGKSLTAVEAVKRAKADGSVTSKSVLVIVSPKVALEQWKREIQVQDPGVPVFMVTSDFPLAANSAGDECYVVTYYEMLLDKEATSFCFAARTWGVIVADEAHRVKNRDALRTKALLRLKAERKIAMSGTPFDRSPAELWTMLHWFDKERFSSFWRFVDAYVQQMPGYRGTEFVGVRPDKREELGTLLREYMTLKTRKQVGQNVRKIVQVQRVTLSKEQKALYDRVRNAKDVLVDIGTGEDLFISNEPTLMTRLLQLSSWPGLLGRKDLPSAKLDWTLAYIANNPKEAMLLFTRFRGTAVELHRRIEKETGEKCGLVIGGEEPIRLAEVLSGQVTRLVGTIAAVGTALDLPMLTTAVFVEMEWSSVLMRQAADRIHRMTTTYPPNIVFLISQRTVDWLLMRRLTDKLTEQQTFELLLARVNDDYETGEPIEQRAANAIA